MWTLSLVEIRHQTRRILWPPPDVQGYGRPTVWKALEINDWEFGYDFDLGLLATMV